ncbi:MAG: hypothetical protein QXE80_03605 [Pyrobaculum sp.]
MTTYLWLDYENRIWFGLLFKELSNGASDSRTYLVSFLENDWLITEFKSPKYGLIKKHAVTVNDHFGLFKILSGLFEELSFKTLQKLTTKLVNAYVFDSSASGLSFSHPHCLSVLHAEKQIPMLEVTAVKLENIQRGREAVYAQQNV